MEGNLAGPSPGVVGSVRVVVSEHRVHHETTLGRRGTCKLEVMLLSSNMSKCPFTLGGIRALRLH